jgi:hypothetical protein
MRLLLSKGNGAKSEADKVEQEIADLDLKVARLKKEKDSL